MASRVTEETCRYYNIPENLPPTPRQTDPKPGFVHVACSPMTTDGGPDFLGAVPLVLLVAQQAFAQIRNSSGPAARITIKEG